MDNATDVFVRLLVPLNRRSGDSRGSLGVNQIAPWLASNRPGAGFHLTAALGRGDDILLALLLLSD